MVGLLVHMGLAVGLAVGEHHRRPARPMYDNPHRAGTRGQPDFYPQNEIQLSSSGGGGGGPF